MTPASENRLNKVHPELATRVRMLIDTFAQNGVQIEVVQGLRTFAEQDALFAQGRTKPGQVVTRARGGQSNHNYGLACFDEQTEILTDMGWKRFADLDETESVMVFKDGRLFYEKPRAYIAYPYEGEMVAIKTRSIDLLTTPNHKFIVQRRHIRDEGRAIEYDREWSEVLAENLTPYYRIPTAGEFTGPTEIDYPLKDKIDPETWWTFMGWYISEGSAVGVSDGVRRTHNGRNKVKISQYRGSAYWPELDMLLADLPYRHRYGGHDFIMDSKELWNVVFPSGNCYQKRIPRYLLNAPKPLLECLFHGLMKGDGTYYQGHEVYWTVNKGLADDVVELCVKLGIATAIQQRGPHESFSPVIGRPVVSFLPQYAVYTRRRRTQELRNGDGQSKITREAYSGFVYCVTTDAGAVMVRRNGKVAICGNCDVVPYSNGKPNWNAPNSIWSAIGAEAEKLGLEWGGDWKRFIDRPHVQLPGLTIKQCYALYQKGGLEAVWATASRLMRPLPVATAIPPQPEPTPAPTAAAAGTPTPPAPAEAPVVAIPAVIVAPAPATPTAAATVTPSTLAQPAPQPPGRPGKGGGAGGGVVLNDRGEGVNLIQTRLAVLGFLDHGNVDGIFGKETQAAVKKFQASKGLTADGIVGPNTRLALMS